jgi:hypothetical protein
MERRRRHTPRIGRNFPERRKAYFDRRQHRGPLRILFIPVGRLFSDFGTVSLF